MSQDSQNLILLLSYFRGHFSATPHHLNAFLKELQKFSELEKYLTIDIKKGLKELEDAGIITKVSTPMSDVKMMMLNSSAREQFHQARKIPHVSCIEKAFVNYYYDLSLSIRKLRLDSSNKSKAIAQDFLQFEYANFKLAGQLALAHNLTTFWSMFDCWLAFLLSRNRLITIRSFLLKFYDTFQSRHKSFFQQDTGGLGVLFNFGGMACERLGDYDSSEFFFKQAVAFSRTKSFKANVYGKWGSMESRRLKFEKAKNLLDRALTLYEGTDSFEIDTISILTDSAFISERTKSFDDALSIYVKCLEICDRYPGMDEEASNVLNSLAILFINQREYQKAIQLLKRCLQIKRKKKNLKVNDITTFKNLSIAYIGIGDSKLAEDCLNEAFDIHYVLSADLMKAPLAHTYGNLAIAQKEYQQALEHMINALRFYNDEASKADCWYNIGKIYSFKNDWKLAKDALKKALKLYERSNINYIDLNEICFEISLFSEKSDDKDDALFYQKQAIARSFTLNKKVAHTCNLALLEAKYTNLETCWILFADAFEMLNNQSDEDGWKSFLTSYYELNESLALDCSVKIANVARVAPARFKSMIQTKEHQLQAKPSTKEHPEPPQPTPSPNEE